MQILPDFGFALLIGWRLYRPDLLAPWAALPFGIAADILTDQPVGVSATIWPATLLALAMIEPRFPMRDVRMDWVLAAAAIVRAKALRIMSTTPPSVSCGRAEEHTSELQSLM